MIKTYRIRVTPQDVDDTINENTYVHIEVSYRGNVGKSDEFTLRMMDDMAVGRNMPYQILPDYRLLQYTNIPIFKRGSKDYDKWFFARDMLAVPIRTKLFV